jgi:hypothetical protein
MAEFGILAILKVMFILIQYVSGFRRQALNLFYPVQDLKNKCIAPRPRTVGDDKDLISGLGNVQACGQA